MEHLGAILHIQQRTYTCYNETSSGRAEEENRGNNLAIHAAARTHRIPGTSLLPAGPAAAPGVKRFGGLSKRLFACHVSSFPANTQTTPNNIAPIPIMRAAMSVLLLTVLLALFPCPVSAALPPGYQDKLLCGAGQCRRPNKRVVASGMVGPQSMFVECLALTTGEVTAVKTWGSKTGVVLETLFAGGFHEAECGADRQQEDPVNQFDADPMGRHEL